MSQKSILVICRKAPYGSSAARDALDIALSGTIFDIPVSLLLLDDAVLQLLPDQNSSLVGEKNLNAMLGALPLYDINQVYTSLQSLALHGLEAQRLEPCPVALDTTELHDLIKRHDVVLTV
ncbi:sulfurtransferase complex subunit TusC [Marinobacterium sediminicola]|uniref:tRNA 2-thiouridine synthesizing protein C n=1 Tax=Marinobacterium sediminicola TaxID=518898 RepID=A0ABY1RXW5_9GAMM|nr:sulfurtransferase complex subunit TusC [Marinobacterium sediminicola]ULG70762.1 sulfurtransferase complex subunit TusC [Marinobacterium sediminicola]SMR71663.1 tRNA 2-thiouridine synthesizing protein C [Marinobacterium sediminicola]